MGYSKQPKDQRFPGIGIHAVTLTTSHPNLGGRFDGPDQNRVPCAAPGKYQLR